MSVQITLDDGVIPFGHNPHHGLDNLEPLNEASETSRKTGLRGGLLAAVSRKIRKTAAADKKGQSVSDQKPRPDSRLSTASTGMFTSHSHHIRLNGACSPPCAP
jgi:hypothetical protein